MKLIIIFFVLHVYSLCFTNALICHTCAYMNSRKTDFNWRKSLRFHKSCKIKSKPFEQFAEQCPNPDETCAGVAFYSEKRRLYLRTCLSTPRPDLQSFCANITNINTINASRQVFKGLFEDDNFNIKLKLCTCNDDKCTPRGFNHSGNNILLSPQQFSEIASNLFEKIDGYFYTSANDSNFPSLDDENISPESGSSFSIWMLVPPFLILLVIALIVILRKLRYKQRNTIETEYDWTFQLHRKSNYNIENLHDEYNSLSIESSVTCFKIDATNAIATNEYDVSYKGKIVLNNTTIEVAVKQPREKLSSKDNLIAVKTLVQEFKVLSHIGTHDNIVRLFGSHAEELKIGRVFVFFELCNCGSLENYLRYLRPNEYLDALHTSLYKELQKWAVEIASGMEFIASKNIVHADLCAQNVLLDYRKTAKISNFGLARSCTINDEFTLYNTDFVNWRWMAPESLRSREFSEKSDVWAFSVVLWEMYTLAEQPFPGLAWPANFATQLDRGLRLKRTMYIEKSLYLLMQKCWEIHPSDRPSFMELKQILSSDDTFQF